MIFFTCHIRLEFIIKKKTFDKNKCTVVHKTALPNINSYSIYEEPGFRNRFLIRKI